MKKPQSFRVYKSGRGRGSLFLGDACAFLKSLRSATAGIVFLDPPFNLGKHYRKGDPSLDRRTVPAYEEWMKDILEESVRILAPGGALYLYHLPIWGIRFGQFLDMRLEFRHWIAVSMKNGFARGRRLYPAHYALLYYTKGNPSSFTRPKLSAVRCRHCDKTIKDYGGYADIILEKGINLSDVWEDLSPVRHATTKKRYANQLPLSLTDRIMHISGSKGMLLVDPFVGSGSSVISAVTHGMRFAACDLVKENCHVVDSRLHELGKTSKRKAK